MSATDVIGALAFVGILLFTLLVILPVMEGDRKDKKASKDYQMMRDALERAHSKRDNDTAR